MNLTKMKQPYYISNRTWLKFKDDDKPAISIALAFIQAHAGLDNLIEVSPTHKTRNILGLSDGLVIDYGKTKLKLHESLKTSFDVMLPYVEHHQFTRNELYDLTYAIINHLKTERLLNGN